MERSSSSRGSAYEVDWPGDLPEEIVLQVVDPRPLIPSWMFLAMDAFFKRRSVWDAVVVALRDRCRRRPRPLIALRADRHGFHGRTRMATVSWGWQEVLYVLWSPAARFRPKGRKDAWRLISTMADVTVTGDAEALDFILGVLDELEVPIVG